MLLAVLLILAITMGWGYWKIPVILCALWVLIQVIMQAFKR